MKTIMDLLRSGALDSETKHAAQIKLADIKSELRVAIGESIDADITLDEMAKLAGLT